MESLRWVLLVVGIVFVLAIYIIGRNGRRKKSMTIDQFDDDIPEFSARNLDDVDEGVGEVKVISGVGQEDAYPDPG